MTDASVGLSQGFDVERRDSLGMQPVCALTRQLHAQIAVEPRPGASFAVTVPVVG